MHVLPTLIDQLGGLFRLVRASSSTLPCPVASSTSVGALPKVAATTLALDQLPRGLSSP